MKLTLDPGAAALLDTLHAAGYAAYAVGGCVRDSLLGRTAHDWDLCTSALPQQVMELFGAEQCIPTGLQHGTVTIKYGSCTRPLPFAPRAAIPMAVTRTKCSSYRMCGRTLPGGILPSTP